MSDLRAKASLLNQPQDGTTGKIFNYMCDHDLTAALSPGFFSGLRNNLMPGDVVRLIQKDSIADMRTGRVLADAEVMVVSVDSTDVIVAPRGPILRYVPPAAPDTGDLVVKWNIAAKAHQVLNAAGDVIGSFTAEQGGKAMAEAMVADLTRKAA